MRRNHHHHHHHDCSIILLLVIVAVALLSLSGTTHSCLAFSPSSFLTTAPLTTTHGPRSTAVEFSSLHHYSSRRRRLPIQTGAVGIHLKATPSPSSDDDFLNSTSLPPTIQSSTIAASPSNDKAGESRSSDITEERIAATRTWNSQNLKIAVPALMGLMADPFLSMVDTGFVGRMGVMDLAALGVCTSVFHMCFSIFRGSTVATISLLHSANTETEKRHIAKISLQLAGVLGTMVLLALRFLGGGTWLLATMGVSPGSPLYQPACGYLFARAWAAPAVVGIVVAEGAFRGNDDTQTPLIASGVASVLNLILDPLMMFPMKLGMVGAAAATAVSQVGAAGVYAWRLWRRKLLPQATDSALPPGSAGKIIQSILGANVSMLAKQGSLLIFYTMATAMATRMGPMHIATHQIALSLFWLVTMWLDSGSISAQMIMGRNLNNRKNAMSLTKYFVKYSLAQGLAFSVIVGGLGSFVPGIFTQDIGIQTLLLRCLPHLAVQQTVVSLVLILEGLSIGANQFRFMAAGTAASTIVGVYQLTRATDVVGIWSLAVNTFFGFRLVNAIIGVARVHWSLKKKEQGNNWPAVDQSSLLPG